MPRRRNRLIAVLLALTLYPGVRASAVSVYDLNPDLPRPLLPTVIDGGNAPVYITNSYAEESGEDGGTTGETGSANGVDSLRIGQRAQLHLGYAPTATASGAVSVGVAGDMSVEGGVRLGKDATYYQYGVPDAATAQAVGLTVGGSLSVLDGGDVVVNGAGDDIDGEARHSVIRADRVDLNGGSLTLEDYAQLQIGVINEEEATEPTDPVEPEETAVVDRVYGLSIRNGGRLVLNGGVPPPEEETEDPEGGEAVEWVFKGVDVGSGSDGILVDAGGSIVSGGAGGVIRTVAGQTLRVEKGGLIDASRGDVIVAGGGAEIAGTYRAGYDNRTQSATGLETPDASIQFETGSAIALSRDLQRLYNKHKSGVYAIAQGQSIDFAGGVPTLETGMGTYELAKNTDTTTNLEYLHIGSVANEVYGTGSAVDREQFRENMNNIWKPGAMRRDQSDNIYNLTALETPTIEAEGEAGELNKAVLEAMTDGRGYSVMGHGYVDQGVFEMYNAAAQWGVNSAAFNTGEEFMAQLDRRVERIGAELDRLGESWDWISGGAFASCAVPEAYLGRVWAGGFSRRDEAELTGGSGYKYRPGGVVFGYDREFGRFNLGAAFAHGSGSYKDKIATSNNSKIKSYSAGLYGSYHSQSGFFATAQATYTHLDNKLSDMRGGMQRRADHDSYAWTLGGKLGYDMPLADRIAVSPSLGLTRTQAVNRRHDETLDNVNVLHVGQVRRDSLAVPFDVALAVDVLRRPEALLRLTGNVGYAYDFYDGGLDGEFSYNGLLGATTMDANARQAGRNRFNAGAGVIFTGRRLDLTARYDYFQRRDQKTHQAKGSVGVKF